MKKAVLFMQGIYSFICLIEVILCLVYQSMDPTVGVDLLLTPMLLLVLPVGAVLIILPISFICSIRLVLSSFKEKSSGRWIWLSWMILSPILYFICFAAAVTLFVSTTGGV